MSEKRRHRCAIYTRKSHEEGLDQAFNSLDAQREACEAYILSQAGLGWELIDKQYDDGGISGGHMDRDGLKELLSDIRAGRIDVVVVYKVDRLTRSITDFGRLVEAFDDHDVSFVSVTQAFNTTNSMGRLTLNVLLSFAQFEREVTAELIRDKIASSKQKGMWMGGRVPFGYRNENKQLFIEPKEAQTVWQMFDLYLEYRNIRLVKEELDRQNIVSRMRINRSGYGTGGIPFTRGNIASILSNPVYAGQIKHKDKIHAGNHQAIVETQMWERVQELLANRRATRSTTKNCSSPALFNGLLFDDNGNRLVPHHANKRGRKYYYYVSQPSEAGEGNKSGIRMPMARLDAIIKSIVNNTLQSQKAMFECLDLKDPTADLINSINHAAQSLATTIKASSIDEQKVIYHQLILRIDIKPGAISIALNPKGLSKYLSTELSEDNHLQIERPMTLRRRGQEMKLVIGGLKRNENNIDPGLIKLIASAHPIRTELENGEASSLKAYAKKHSIDHGDARNLIPLAYLAPSIIEDILAGHQPANLTSLRLKHAARHLPHLWSEQRQVLGFTV